MQMKNIIVTNNKIVEEHNCELITISGEFRDVLVKARDMIHAGHRLLVSPLPASIRMFYSPVRSIVLSEKNEEIDVNSANMIENAIAMYDKSMGERNIDYKNLKDYEILDRELLQSAFNELRDADL